MAPAMIHLEGVTKSYRLGKSEVLALRGVDLTVARGELVCLMGPSGSGKTTLLNLIGCLDRPDHGKLFIGEEEVSALSRSRLAAIRAKRIGFIFQSFNLIPVLDVYENIEFPLFIKRERLTRQETRSRVMTIIEAIGLKEFIRHRPDELSGGQRQRVAIARALVTRPELVLADEPTANLDSETGRAIISLMRDLNAEQGTTFIFATHDPSIMSYASCSYRVHDGVVRPLSPS